MACRTASRRAAAFLLLSIASIARSAPAEPSANDKNLAQSLFDDGRRLMDQRRYAEACPRFEESERLDPGGGTVLNLALCYDKRGLLALAYRTYSDAISLAIAEHRSERERFARERIAAIAQRLPHVTFEVASADGIEIKLDGTVVPPAAWAAATPLDPGAHTVDAIAPGYAPWQAFFTSKEGETRHLVVALVPVAPASSLVSVPGSAAPADRPSPLHIESRRSAAFYVIGGVGLASFAASLVTGAMAWSSHQNVAQKCSASTGFCADPSGIDDASRARTFAWASTATLGGGVLATIVALALPVNKSLSMGAIPGGALLSLRLAWR